MKEHPILFSSQMIIAILAGKKTVTRRVIKFPVLGPSDGSKRRVYGPGDPDLSKHCPLGKAGSRLWVRETWRTEEPAPDHVSGIRFRADDAFVAIENTREAADRWVETHDSGKHGNDWRPSIFMRPWMCRIRLEVTDVRAERLQDMDGFAAIAEGIPAKERCGCGVCMRCAGMCPADHGVHVEEFAALWDSINGKRPGCAWKDNPWVWAISFRRVTP